MTNVSWKRILQSAESGIPGDEAYPGATPSQSNTEGGYRASPAEQPVYAQPPQAPAPTQPLPPRAPQPPAPEIPLEQRPVAKRGWESVFQEQERKAVAPPRAPERPRPQVPASKASHHTLEPSRVQPPAPYAQQPYAPQRPLPESWPPQGQAAPYAQQQYYAQERSEVLPPRVQSAPHQQQQYYTQERRSEAHPAPPPRYANERPRAELPLPKPLQRLRQEAQPPQMPQYAERSRQEAPLPRPQHVPVYPQLEPQPQQPQIPRFALERFQLDAPLSAPERSWSRHSPSKSPEQEQAEEAVVQAQPQKPLERSQPQAQTKPQPPQFSERPKPQPQQQVQRAAEPTVQPKNMTQSLSQMHQAQERQRQLAAQQQQQQQQQLPPERRRPAAPQRAPERQQPPQALQRQAIQRQQPALRQALDALERQSAAQHQAVERNAVKRRPSPKPDQLDEELGLSALPVYQLPMTIPQPLPTPQRRKGGIRNFLVVTLCLGVLGFSGHVVSKQWSKSPNGSVVAIQQAHAEVPANTQHAATDNVSATGTDQTAVVVTTASSSDAAIDIDKELPVSAPQQAATATEEEWGGIVTTQSSTTQTSAVEEKVSSKISREEEQRLMRSGTMCLQLGNVSCARRYYTRLAEQDSAIGAVSLAKTFDPNIMDNASLKGAATDKKKAREWYQRAVQLGNNEAAEHLKKL